MNLITICKQKGCLELESLWSKFVEKLECMTELELPPGRFRHFVWMMLIEQESNRFVICETNSVEEALLCVKGFHPARAGFCIQSKLEDGSSIIVIAQAISDPIRMRNVIMIRSPKGKLEWSELDEETLELLREKANITAKTIPPIGAFFPLLSSVQEN